MTQFFPTEELKEKWQRGWGKGKKLKWMAKARSRLIKFVMVIKANI